MIALSACAVGAAGGWLVGRIANQPNLTPILMVVLGADGFGFGVFWYWRWTPRAREYGPWTMFWTFVLVGARLSIGAGPALVALTGLANGLFGLVLAQYLVREPPEAAVTPPAGEDAPASTDSAPGITSTGGAERSKVISDHGRG